MLDCTWLIPIVVHLLMNVVEIGNNTLENAAADQEDKISEYLAYKKSTNDLLIIKTISNAVYSLDLKTNKFQKLLTGNLNIADCFSNHRLVVNNSNNLRLQINNNNDVYLFKEKPADIIEVVFVSSLKKSPLYIDTHDLYILSCKKDQIISIDGKQILYQDNYAILTDGKNIYQSSSYRELNYNSHEEEYDSCVYDIDYANLQCVFGEANRTLNLPLGEIAESIFLLNSSHSQLQKISLEFKFKAASLGSHQNAITFADKSEIYIIDSIDGHLMKFGYKLPNVPPSTDKFTNYLCTNLIKNSKYGIITLIGIFMALLITVMNNIFRKLINPKQVSYLQFGFTKFYRFDFDNTTIIPIFVHKGEYEAKPFLLRTQMQFNHPNLIRQYYFPFLFSNNFKLACCIDLSVLEFCHGAQAISVRKKLFLQLISVVKYAIQNKITINFDIPNVFTYNSDLKLFIIDSKIVNHERCHNLIHSCIFHLSENMKFKTHTEHTLFKELLCKYQSLISVTHRKTSCENAALSFTLRKIKNQPAMWSPNRCIHFIKICSDIIEKYKLSQDDDQQKIARNLDLYFSNESNWIDKWPMKLRGTIFSFRHYNFQSYRDLIRLIRNITTHFFDSEYLNYFDSSIKNFYIFTLDSFPKLVLYLYAFMMDHIEENEILIAFYKPL